MERPPNAANCRWAVPTLFLSTSAWLQAWDAPWSCVRDGDARALESTERCGDCPRWESGPKPDVSSHSVEVPIGRWKEVLEEFGVMHHGWLVSVDLVPPNAGAPLEFSNLPLLGVMAEPRHDGLAISVSAGKSAAERLTHTIPAPSRVWLERSDDGAGRSIQVEAANGAKTILRFSSPARPDPADNQART